ncbi:NAD-glutamate dehydrogenase [Chromobacterium haemolyticum]|nr:NAD-glutamate dehydrogenase [Chromobacterium haemolyticum]
MPILRQKVATVIRNCDYVDDSYKSKTLNFVLEAYPRDELFEIPAEVLGPISEGIVSLQERPRVRLFVRKDRYHRYVSCLVYVPRDSFNTEVRLKIEKVLMNAFNGASAEFSVQISDGSLARVHYIIRTNAAKLPEFHEADIEAEIARLVRGWVERNYINCWWRPTARNWATPCSTATRARSRWLIAKSSRCATRCWTSSISNRSTPIPRWR